MSAAVHPRTEIRLMQPADLKSVAAVERAADWEHRADCDIDPMPL